MKPTYILSIVLLLAVTITNAQSTIERSVVAAGGNSNSAGSYSIDWTVGEAVINTYTAGAHMLSQGFHQHTAISLGINKQQLNIVLDAYPNPVTDQLWLQINQPAPSVLHVNIADINGRSLIRKELPGNTSITQQFNMAILPAGMYLLHVYEGAVIVRTIKVIKQ